ncbi:MAG: hypothetical protein LPK11_01385 [Chromatiaceae bacterium]|nr:hypothetical protein [Chromatiaceae bacterium]
MSDNQPKMTTIELDEYLLRSAEAVFEQLPKSPNEIIERWAWIGKAVAEQLTEDELLNVQCGNAKIQVIIRP